MMNGKTKLLIIGAGAAGMTAACAAWNAGCRDIVLVDRKELPGGILLQCTHKGFPYGGKESSLTGPEYAEILYEQLRRTGVRFLPDTTVVRLEKDNTAVMSSSAGFLTCRYEHLILSTGCRERPLESLGIAGTRPGGIYTAGQVQEMMNLYQLLPGEQCVVLGSGDLGALVAAGLKERGKQVLILEKKSRIGAMERNRERCIRKWNIPVWTGTELTGICGSGRITGVRIFRKETADEEIVPCDALISAIGMIPDQALLEDIEDNKKAVTLCGNCARIHPLVESAVAEARALGTTVGRLLA